MRLFIDSVMVFFGTLMAAGLLALAGLAGLGLVTPQDARSAREAASQVLVSSHSHYTQKASPPRAPH